MENYTNLHIYDLEVHNEVCMIIKILADLDSTSFHDAVCLKHPKMFSRNSSKI